MTLSEGSCIVDVRVAFALHLMNKRHGWKQLPLVPWLLVPGTGYQIMITSFEVVLLMITCKVSCCNMPIMRIILEIRSSVLDFIQSSTCNTLLGGHTLHSRFDEVHILAENSRGFVGTSPR